MAAATAGGDINPMHRHKLPPPQFAGEHATFEKWKHKFVAYLETVQETEQKQTFGYNSAKTYTTTHQCLLRTSSCPLQTTHTTSSWSRDKETTTQALFNTTWYTQRRVPYKAFETTIQREQIRGVPNHMGI